MSKRCLPRAILSRSSRVRVRTDRQPQTTDTNEHDGWIWRTLRRMEKDIRELEERTKEISARVEKTNAVLEKTSALVEKTSAQLEKRSEEIRALGERIRAIGEEVTILSPLKSIAISMQEGSSAASQSGEGVGEIEDRLAGWIESIEPTADVITDVCMFKNGLMHDNRGV